ncbi:Dissimilatory sulfite reductase [Desulfosporosinus sp. I2]|uniref:sulfite reductase subunit beta n=1 Tax=Desulfosporosinus sp. I2 TaxID=1617025 RepID=UPI0005EF905C|nr:sulfite reductase subunit beta [Desulfosporosinus sp. I2]KJR49479.1 Dissimilatory sulfite reductase [Desulfosporosinus sp. I2]
MELTDDQKKSLLGQGYIASEDGAHFACRVLVPAGKMTTQATQKISEVSEKYGKGYFSLTQRLNVEIPWIPYQDLDNVTRELKEVGLSIGGTGPRVRPALTCKGTVCKRGLLDTDALAQVIDERFYNGYYKVMLPNKLRIIVSGCSNSCSKPQIGCIGLQGRTRNQVAISLGGMFGKDHVIGRELPSLYSIKDALNMIEKVITYYRDNGLKGERFAKMVDRIGFEGVENFLCSQNSEA